MSRPSIIPSFKHTPATLIAMIAAYDSGVESGEPGPVNFSGLHAGDMCGVLSRVGFTECDRQQSELARVFTMRSPKKGFIVTVAETLGRNLTTSVSVNKGFAE